MTMISCSSETPAATWTGPRCGGDTSTRSQRQASGRLRFHDLRHTFGTRMIAKADIRRVQEWMGHADIQTTMRYLHYSPRRQDAALVAEAFRVEAIQAACSAPELA
jgi:integrase